MMKSCYQFTPQDLVSGRFLDYLLSQKITPFISQLSTASSEEELSEIKAELCELFNQIIQTDPDLIQSTDVVLDFLNRWLSEKYGFNFWINSSHSAIKVNDDSISVDLTKLIKLYYTHRFQDILYHLPEIRKPAELFCTGLIPNFIPSCCQGMLIRDYNLDQLQELVYQHRVQLLREIFGFYLTERILNQIARY